MSCCPRLPAVSTWDPAKNQKRSIERALRKAQAKEEESNQPDIIVEDNE